MGCSGLDDESQRQLPRTLSLERKSETAVESLPDHLVDGRVLNFLSVRREHGNQEDRNLFLLRASVGLEPQSNCSFC